MTHYLRDKNGDTIVDIEALKDDIHCVVNIEAFSAKLLSLPINKSITPIPSWAISERCLHRDQWIQDMDAMQEIRGGYWETDANTTETPDQYAKHRCKEMAEKWELAYVTD